MSQGVKTGIENAIFFLFYPEDKLKLASQDKGLTPVCGNRSGERKGRGGTGKCSAGRAGREQAGPLRVPSCLVTTGAGKQAEGA